MTSTTVSTVATVPSKPQVGKGVGTKGRPKTPTMVQIERTEKQIKTLQLNMDAAVSLILTFALTEPKMTEKIIYLSPY